MTTHKKLFIFLLFLACIEVTLIDRALDAQEQQDAQSNRWNAALIDSIQHMHDDK